MKDFLDKVLEKYPAKTYKNRKEHIVIKKHDDDVLKMQANTRTIPGIITNRGCCYAGCKGVVLGPIKDMVHIVHGPIGCSYYAWGTRRNKAKTEPGMQNYIEYCFSTDMQESDIVFGGEKKLRQAVKEAVEIFHPTAITISATCPVGLIGDDINAVAREAEELYGIQVLAFNCEGYKGVSQSAGHHIANNNLMRSIIGKGTKVPTKKYSINLLGEYNIGGDGFEISRILEKIGYEGAVNVGYFGSLRFLDEITNAILERKERGYRKDMYDKYFVDEKVEKVEKIISIEDRTKTHPCFNQCAHEHARIHIPVAPKCNISCNYCSRKFDCVNESRPGVTSSILSPIQALERFKEFKSKLKNLTVAGIAGPGDALANFDEVKKSIELIRNESPEITFCLSTNGLMLPFYANEILELGVSHVTITINTVDPEIGAKLYKEINYLGVKYIGVEGARILLQNQLSGLKYLASKGLVCKVNIVYVKGVNDSGIEATVKKVKECGAFMTNIMPMINAPGSRFEHITTVNSEELLVMRKKCEVDLKQMYHCRQCRADAVGTLLHDISQTSQSNEMKPIRFAVASKTGLNIDQHFGHATEFYIYDFVNGDAKFTEKREVPKFCTGKEDCDDVHDSHEGKIDKIIKTIEDCSSVLTLRIGDEPKRKLEIKNIKVYELYDEIKNGIRKIVGEDVS